MTTFIVTDSGVEFGLCPLACRREGHCFLVPVAVRTRKEQSAYNFVAARYLFGRILERDDVTETNVVGQGPELEPALNQKLDQICSHYMSQRRKKGCSASDEPKYLEQAKLDIRIFKAAAATIEGELIALVSGLTRRYFQAAGISCITGSEIEANWQRTDLYNEARKFDRKNFFVEGCLPPLLFFGGPFLLVGLIQLLWFIISPAVEAMTGFVIDQAAVWRAAIVFWLIGVGLYLIRSRYRLFYGVAETLFGVILSYMAFPKVDPESTLTRWLSFFAALYVMVRGLDNIGKSLKNPASVRVWTWIFGDNYK
jgi:hypothetical protein